MTARLGQAELRHHLGHRVRLLIGPDFGQVRHRARRDGRREEINGRRATRMDITHRADVQRSKDPLLLSIVVVSMMMMRALTDDDGTLGFT